MEQLTVRWHGHACFSLTCRDFTVVLDPYEDHYVPGFPPLRLTGDLVLCSHQHNDHNAAGDCHPPAPAAQPLPYHQNSHLPRPGRGPAAGGEHHPSAGGGQAAGGPFRGLGLSPLSRAKGRAPGPGRGHGAVGGFYTIGPQEAKALLDDLRPKVFLPMHYRMGAVGLPAVGQVEDFLSLVENYVYYPTDTLSLDEGTKPQIAVLHCSV